MNIRVAKKVRPVLYGKARYKILYGGRGSTKSWAVADYLIIKAAFGKVRILCTREIQGSIRDSVYRTLVDRIYFYKLQSYFIIGTDSIKGIFGSEFIFKGLRQNISEIKSTEGIDICWVEEAEKVCKESWDTLTPTIRKDDSEIIITFNPDDEKSETFTRFIEKDGKPVNLPNCLKAFVNWWDNPWFPEVLRVEMEWCRRFDHEKYEHVWGGKPKKYGQSVIFKKKLRIESFEDPDPDTTQFHFGGDWGFGVDPNCLIRMFIKDRKLYIDREFYGYAVEIDDLPAAWDTVPGARLWPIIADSARPDMVSHMSNKGFACEGAEKGEGSIKDGIEYLNSFEAIVIHPRCEGAIGDFENYRWKVDKTTEKILPIPVDKSNHACDAVRYALEKYMKEGVSIYDTAI